MDSCPYYSEIRYVGKEKRRVPCCRHKHTPAACNGSSRLTETPYALRCGGRLSKCQIPPHEQLDIA